METVEQNNQNNPNPEWEQRFNEHIKRRRAGKIFAGIIIVIVGAVMLAKEMGAYFPEWLFSWKTLLIVIGLFAGVQHSFRGGMWIVLILVGSAFLIQDFYPTMYMREYLWPILIIIFGLMMIFRPRRKWNMEDYHNRHRARFFGRHGRYDSRFHRRHDMNFCSSSKGTSPSEDRLNMDIVFSGFEKKIISKDFKGGAISLVFGGGNLNLSQADINGTVVLEVNQVFGGIKIIVPSNWDVQTGEIQAIFGGVEDKRHIHGIVPNTDKILVLKGSVVFGGVDIRSY